MQVYLRYAFKSNYFIVKLAERVREARSEYNQLVAAHPDFPAAHIWHNNVLRPAFLKRLVPLQLAVSFRSRINNNFNS